MFYGGLSIIQHLPGYEVTQTESLENLQYKVMSGVFLVSIPSLPIFLLLQFLKNKFVFKTSILFQSSISFCFALLMGDIFYHMLPELTLNEIQMDIMILGIVFLWFLENILALFYVNSQDDKHEHCHDASDQKAIVYLFSDFFHNFTDGIAIGASFLISDSLGKSTVLATAFHEIPHELSDFAYLINKNYSITAIMKSQIITSLGAFIGAYLGLYIGNIYKQELLALTIGVFIYNSVYSLLPEITESIRNSYSKGQMLKKIIVHLFAIAIGLKFMKQLH